MEILVHTISHSDLVLEFTRFGEKDKLQIVGRPKFSCYHPVSEQLLNVLSKVESGCSNSSVVRSFERKMDHPNYEFKVHCAETMYPIGIRLDSSPIFVEDVADFRFKQGDVADGVMEGYKTKRGNWKVYITAVYFPLLALLLPKWKQVLTDHDSNSSKKVVYLISGAGIPRNVNHAVAGNSTEETAKLMKLFVNAYFPSLLVEQVHSGSDIFRYDDNVSFVNESLRPLIEVKRQDIVKKRGDQWKKHFHITIAYGDGAPARLSALNASLRLFRPSYLHIWQLKTFWHEGKLSMDDIDFHGFENVETTPAVPIHKVQNDIVHVLVAEMKLFRDQFEDSRCFPNEISQFWLRKTRKPVLAILIVQKSPNDKPTVYRGMNCEVSMPTGSLCAERNVIGSALADDPTLHRSQIRAIGVLSVYLEAPVAPQSPMRRVQHIKRTDTASKDTPWPSQVCIAKYSPQRHSMSGSARKEGITSPIAQRKPKRPRTVSCDELSVNTLPDTNYVDANPLAPCGSCKEWLLKIAEANPALLVVTFSNSSCNEIYMKQLM